MESHDDQLFWIYQLLTVVGLIIDNIALLKKKNILKVL